MKLTFIGTGSAFTVGDNFHSNLLLESSNGDRLLLDCGTDARHALFKLGLNYSDIDSVYISHLHADHAGGLEWLGFSRKFDMSCARPELHIAEDLLEPLWEQSLSASMQSIHNHASTLKTYFKAHPISKGVDSFTWQDQQFNLIKVHHVYHDQELVPCYGLFFTLNGKNIWWTADTTFTPDLLQEYYQSADLIFHDCETSPHGSTVHTRFSELNQLDSEIKAKMWLYHYNPGPLPDAVGNGFRGFVKPGQMFDLADPNTYGHK